VFYTYLDEWQQWFSRKKEPAKVVAGTPEVAPTYSGD